MNNKRKGTRAEHKCRDYLVNRGYYVFRSAGSFGCIDLVAINPLEVKLIQVKANKYITKEERETMSRLKCISPSCVSMEVWRYKDYVKQPIVEIIKCELSAVLAEDVPTLKEMSQVDGLSSKLKDSETDVPV